MVVSLEEGSVGRPKVNVAVAPLNPLGLPGAPALTQGLLR